MVKMTGCIDVIMSSVSGKSKARHNLSMISIAAIDIVYYLLYLSRVRVIDVPGICIFVVPNYDSIYHSHCYA